MDTVTVIAGQVISVGTIASFLAQFVKDKDWFPTAYRTTIIRFGVALVCVLASVGVSLITGAEMVSVETVVESFLSYLAASAAYDHLFKD